ncbi:hypothetical protein [Parvularcula sp. LCG005]|uniref:hypothetical protein n=1 Tax=Parvularcula sp. LCG005 TaxID=3078805 RepID=UPI00294373A0|nr:hypothetical protein [Parvularcula sp. LCG005]WOI54315.1 hypothetical protein RUI03_04765 [Parvularcula sp. LCG005]
MEMFTPLIEPVTPRQAKLLAELEMLKMARQGLLAALMMGQNGRMVSQHSEGMIKRQMEDLAQREQKISSRVAGLGVIYRHIPSMSDRVMPQFVSFAA